MQLIETRKVFETAIKTQSLETIEKIMQCSDCLDDLIKQYCQNHCSEAITQLSEEFKSKGLKIRVQNIVQKYKNLHLTSTTKEQKKIILTHHANKLHNESTHLQGNSYL